MNKAFKYRIYPSKSQVKILNKNLEMYRYIYNELLSYKKTSWETKKISISRYGLTKYTKDRLGLIKSEISTLHAQSVQEVSARIDLAFKAFFRRCKSGDRPGYPRFKGKNQYKSFTYPQNNGSFKLQKCNKKIYLSKIGKIKIRYHRPLKGIPKTCTVKKYPTGKWFVFIVCEDVPTKKLEPSNLATGIDVGLSSFATLTEEESIKNPKFFQSEEKAVSCAQKKLSKAPKGTTERTKAKKIVSRVYERINNKRDNFCHQESRRLINKYDSIFVEDLNINRMVEDGKAVKLSKKIQDVAWGKFLSYLSYKAENAGRNFVKVNPAYTSQDCSSCHTRQKIELKDRVFKCCNCNLVIDRDLNAARNIKALGLQCLIKRSKS